MLMGNLPLGSASEGHDGPPSCGGSIPPSELPITTNQLGYHIFDKSGFECLLHLLKSFGAPAAVEEEDGMIFLDWRGACDRSLGISVSACGTMRYMATWFNEDRMLRVQEGTLTDIDGTVRWLREGG